MVKSSEAISFKLKQRNYLESLHNQAHQHIWPVLPSKGDIHILREEQRTTMIKVVALF